MEEKERYEIFGKHCIKDNNPNAHPQLLDVNVTCVVLNDQDKHIKLLEEVNQQLKQQLHDLPKKIVEEIIEELYDCGKTYLEDEPYIEICIVKGILDTILKKYGEQDE